MELYRNIKDQQLKFNFFIHIKGFGIYLTLSFLTVSHYVTYCGGKPFQINFSSDTKQKILD